MSETAVEEVVGLSRRAGRSADRVTHRLETHREQALSQLQAAKRELDTLIEKIEDDQVWIGEARRWIGHAGYSNGIVGNVNSAYVSLGQVAGIVDTVVF